MAGQPNDLLSTELVFDLRLTYATILDNYMKRIVVARDNKQYSLWFELLENLYIEVNQKLKDKEREEYEELVKKTLGVITKYSAEYSSQSTNTKNIFHLTKQLREMDKWIKNKMEDKKLFGGSKYTPGLS